MVDVSIVVPVYNREKYIAECLESILSQTFKGSKEIIVIDDGSTDSSTEIVSFYENRGVKLIKKEHTGLCDTLNKVIQFCNGKYFVRVDSDDILLPNAIIKEFNFLENNKKYDIVSGFCVFKENNKKSIKYGEKKEVTKKDFRKRCPILNCGCMVKMDVIKSFINEPYNKKYEYAEDYEFFIKCLKKGYKIYNLNFPICVYRRHGIQNTSFIDENGKRFADTSIEKILKDYKDFLYN